MQVNSVSVSNQKQNFGTLKIMPSARKVLTDQISKRLAATSELREARIPTQKLELSYMNSFLDTLEKHFDKFKEPKMTLKGTKNGALRFSFSPDTKTLGKKTRIVLVPNEDQRLNQCTLENIQDVAAEYHQIVKEKPKNGEYDPFHFFRFFKQASATANMPEEHRRYWTGLNTTYLKH